MFYVNPPFRGLPRRVACRVILVTKGTEPPDLRILSPRDCFAGGHEKVDCHLGRHSFLLLMVLS